MNELLESPLRKRESHGDAKSLVLFAYDATRSRKDKGRGFALHTRGDKEVCLSRSRRLPQPGMLKVVA